MIRNKIYLAILFGEYSVQMSDPDPLLSPESIIMDFKYNIEDFKDFILKSKKRELNDSQRKVIIKNKISAIKASYNDITRNPKVEPEARSNALFDSISKLTDVYNLMDFTNKFELIWFEINSLINSFASALITSHNQGDIWSMQGSAALLVQIILGLPRIEHLPEQLQSSIDDPEYLDRWKVTFNCVQFSAETYTGVVYAIKTVGLLDFIYWVNQSYHYYSLLKTYFDIFDFEKISQVLKNRLSYFFKMVFIMCNAFQNMLEHSLLLVKILGSKWPLEISTMGLFEDRTLGGVLNLIKQVKGVNSKALDKLNDLFKSEQWSMNDNPMQAGPIQFIIEIDKIYDYQASYIESLKVIEPEIHKLSSNANNKTVINTLQQTINLFEVVQSHYEHLVGSRNNILTSPFAGNFIDLLGKQLEMVCLLVISTGEIEPIENLFKTIDWVLSDENIRQFGNFIVKKFLIELFIATKFAKKQFVEKLYTDLQTILEMIVKQPRDFTSFVTLEAILGFLLGKKGIPKKDEILVKMNKNGFIVSGDLHLVDEFQEYVDYLLSTLNGEKFDVSERLLKRKTYVNISDSITWLIPDFNLVFKEKLKVPLFYLPFNRYCDGIINFYDL